MNDPNSPTEQRRLDRQNAHTIWLLAIIGALVAALGLMLVRKYL
jgi:hypothetical protein